jgi:hypothetical protein
MLDSLNQASQATMGCASVPNELRALQSALVDFMDSLVVTRGLCDVNADGRN